jgi:L-lactate dehydrogenase complex protein LldG
MLLGRVVLRYTDMPPVSAKHTETFTASLRAAGGDAIRTDAGDFRATVADAVTPPVVGAELPFSEVSLASVDDVDITLRPTLTDLRAARTGITAAALGIADYGSVVLRLDRALLTEPASLFVDDHVVVIRASDIHPDMSAAISELGPLLRDNSESVVIATGPSATADMGALVRGAHGPETVRVIILTDR